MEKEITESDVRIANELFGEYNWDGIYKYGDDKDSLCLCDDCKDVAEQVAIVRVCESVCFVPVCKKHWHKWHSVHSVMFPFKK